MLLSYLLDKCYTFCTENRLYYTTTHADSYNTRTNISLCVLRYLLLILDKISVVNRDINYHLGLFCDQRFKWYYVAVLIFYVAIVHHGIDVQCHGPRLFFDHGQNSNTIIRSIRPNCFLFHIYLIRDCVIFLIFWNVGSPMFH